jgi:uncharacterized protein YyaL (SSP411 family)
LLKNHRDGEGRLLRQAGSTTRGFLADHAFTIQGLVDLHDATSEARWLDAALELQRIQDAHHYDELGGYFTAPDDGEALLTRKKPLYDGAEPSGNSVSVRNLLRLHALTEDPSLRARAEHTLRWAAPGLRRSPTGSPAMLVALDFALARALQVFVIGPRGQPPDPALVAVLRQTLVPNGVQLVLDAGEVERRASSIPGLQGKRPLAGKATAFVCEQSVCQLPTHDPKALRAQLVDLSSD